MCKGILLTLSIMLKTKYAAPLAVAKASKLGAAWPKLKAATVTEINTFKNNTKNKIN